MKTVDYQEGLLKRLQDPKYASEYLSEALKEGSHEIFMMALRDVAMAKGIDLQSGMISVDELFEDFEKDALPGVALLGARTKEGITQKQLSELTGISQAHISEMENHKRTIGKKAPGFLGKP